MRKQYGFYIEIDKCVGCQSCEVACKNWNDVEPGPRWRRVITTTKGRFPDVAKAFASISCMHCGNAPCEKVCPTGAISKRHEDGIVIVDRSKCIGCHYCFFACPFGSVQFGSDGTMQKCDMCIDRIEEGKEPACVATCKFKALHFGTLLELSKLVPNKHVERLAEATRPSLLFNR